MKALHILLTILLFGVVVTIGLVVIPTPGTKTDSSKAAEGGTMVIGVELGAKSITLAPASLVKAPTENVKKGELQPDAGEKFDPSEIRQALSELDAMVKKGGSTQEIQEKKAALKAAIDRGIKKDPKGVLSFVFPWEIFGPDPIEPGPELSLLVQIDPDLAIALLDQVPEENDLSVESILIGWAWAETDPKAALAWANEQTDPELKGAILTGVLATMAKSDLQGALAAAQSLNNSDRLISAVFWAAASNNPQGALNMMQSLPAGRAKDAASKGISEGMAHTGSEWAETDPKAALAWANQQTDPELKLSILERVLPIMAKTDLQGALAAAQSFNNSERLISEVFSNAARNNPQGALNMMQSLPAGRAKDAASKGISEGMRAKGDYQAAMNIASGISDTTMRTNAQSSVAFSSVTFFDDSSWTRTDPQGALAWAKQQTDPELKGRILQRVLPIMAETDLQGALAWANQQTDPELKGRILEGVLPVMAESDLQGALAWANQQTDPELKGRILQGVLPIMAKSDLQGALAAAQSLNNSERLISKVFSNAASNNPQGALNMMQSLPAGRAKDAASEGISMGMAEKGDYQAAMNIASGISDIKTRTDAQAEVFVRYFQKDRAAATQWLQSLPAGQAKDVFSDRIIVYANTLVGMNIASGISDTTMRNEAQAKVARKWLEIDRVGATQWINSSSLPQDVKNGLLQQE